MKEDIIMPIVLAVIGSGALFTFIQFLITLAFSRKDKVKEIDQKIDKLADKMDENQAVLARTHILRFSDELKNGIHHSAEYFRQQLDDCDTYDRYCEEHPKFKNSYTMTAKENTRRPLNN